MEKETMNLKYTLENIKADKKAYENFQKAQTVEEVYKICKEYGYEGTYEKLVKEVTDLMSMNLQNVSMSDLEKVAGGKLEAKKGIAGALSALSLMSGMMPLSGAAEVKQKTVNEKSTINQKIGSVLNKVDKQAVGVGLGGLAAGALIMKLFSRSSSMPANKEILTEKSFFTEEGKEVFRKINEFRDYLKSNENLKNKIPLYEEEENVSKQLAFWENSQEYWGDKKITNLFNNVITSLNNFMKAQFNIRDFSLDYRNEYSDTAVSRFSFFGLFHSLALRILYQPIYSHCDPYKTMQKQRYDATILVNYLREATYIDFYQ